MLLIVHQCFLMLSRKIIVRKATLQTTNKFSFLHFKRKIQTWTGWMFLEIKNCSFSKHKLYVCIYLSVIVLDILIFELMRLAKAIISLLSDERQGSVLYHLGSTLIMLCQFFLVGYSSNTNPQPNRAIILTIWNYWKFCLKRHDVKKTLMTKLC